MIKDSLEYLFRRLQVRDELTEEERAALTAAAGERKTLPAGTVIAREGESPSFSTLLVSGMVARETIVEDGAKQITAFHIAGDFVDLHGFLVAKLDHSVSALTEIEVVRFPHQNLKRITEQFPHLTRLLWLSTLLDGAVHRQWLVAMGRMSSLAHTAHLLCEMYVRSDMVGLVDEHGSYPLEITQQQLADALGLSVVHVNRVIQELRRQELIRWDGKRIAVLDWDGLRSVGQFDPTFLDVTARPR